jgi:hypothetical protein
MAGSKKGVNDGQMKGEAVPEPFGNPVTMVPEPVKGMAGTYNDIGEKSGFQTDGFIDKKGMCYGEAAKLNFLPPGDEITNQEYAEFNNMPMRKLTSESYPGDGWSPAPRDIPE